MGFSLKELRGVTDAQKWKEKRFGREDNFKAPWNFG
jgi:hypothetical protein